MRIIHQINYLQRRVANIFCPNNPWVLINREPKAARPITFKYDIFRMARVALYGMNASTVNSGVFIHNSDPVYAVSRSQTIAVSLGSSKVVCMEGAGEAGRLFWVKPPAVLFNLGLSVPKRMIGTSIRNYTTEVSRLNNSPWQQNIPCRVKKHVAFGPLNVLQSLNSSLSVENIDNSLVRGLK